MYIEIRLKKIIPADEMAPIANILAPSFPIPSIERKNPMEAIIGAKLNLARLDNCSEYSSGINHVARIAAKMNPGRKYGILDRGFFQ